MRDLNSKIEKLQRAPVEDNATQSISNSKKYSKSESKDPIPTPPPPSLGSPPVFGIKGYIHL